MRSVPLPRPRFPVWLLACLVGLAALPASVTFAAAPAPAPARRPFPRILVTEDRTGLQTDRGQPFLPLGVTWYRPGTGWAPQVWKQFDPVATRSDFRRMKELGINTVRVFLSFGSFLNAPDSVDEDGLRKFDALLEIAEETSIYLHPTGPDHWEGLPDWARVDRYADEKVLAALEQFWRVFAARYRGHTALFAYDLLNEPEVPWDTPVLRSRWPLWLQKTYGELPALAKAWNLPAAPASWDAIPIPPGQDAPRDPALLAYQHFRESIAETWVSRQVQAIRSVDRKILVTAGLIQWSVPAVLAHSRHYSAFPPSLAARHLDFLEIHFYPLENGAYEYKDAGSELRNLAYLESVLRECARQSKPVVIAEFGWYGGGQPRFDNGKHPAATETQQAEWCSRLVEVSRGLACGWLNWGLYDQPEATDPSQFTGLLASDGRIKSWGRAVSLLSTQLKPRPALALIDRPSLDWDLALTSGTGRAEFRKRYLEAFQADPRRQHIPALTP